jgi:hypothetical protein
MTTHTREQASETRIARAGCESSQAPSAGDFAFGLIDAFAAVGIVFVAFLAPIPGLFPAVILTVLFVAPLLIPLVVLGVVALLAFALLCLAARLTSRAVALFFPTAAPSVRRPRGSYRAADYRPANDATPVADGLSSSISGA